MTFIALPINDMDDVQEDKPVPEGEYNLIISDCKEKTDDNGNIKGLLVICEIQGVEGAANVLHNVSFPLPGDDEEKVKNKLKFLKRFVQLFKIPVKGNQVNPQDFLGKSAKCMLGQKEYQGTISNEIKLPQAK